MSFDALLCHSCTIRVRALATADSYGEQAETWTTTDRNVRCRFYYDRVRARYEESTGPAVDQALKVILSRTVTVAANTNRIVTTATGFAGTYVVVQVQPVYDATGIHHYIATLEAVLS